MLSLSVFPLTSAFFRPLPLGSGYSAFLLFRSLLPGSASQLLSRCRPLRFRFPGFPLTLRPVARASRPLLVLGLSAGFLSPLPVPLPQPLPWCLPSSGSLRPLLFGLFPSDLLPFVRLSSVLTTQLSALSFPCFPLSPGFGSFGAFRSVFTSRLSPSVPPVSMRSFRFWYSAFCNSFRPPLSRLTVATPASQPSSYWTSAAPLCFRFRFRLLGLSVLNFSVRLRPRIYYHRRLNLSIPIFCLFQLLSCILQPTCSIKE